MESILISAFLGGLFAFIGYFFGHLLRSNTDNHKKKSYLTAISVVVAISIGNILAPTIKEKIFARTKPRFETISTKQYMKLFKDDRYLALIKGKSSEDIHTISKDLSATGMKLLSTGDLQVWNSLRLTLAMKNKSVCTGFWNGSMDLKEFLSTLDLLKDSEIEAWADITVKASLLSLENRKPAKVNQTELSSSFREIGNQLDADSKKKYLELLPKGITLSNEDACWMITTIMKVTPTLDENKKSAILHGLASF